MRNIYLLLISVFLISCSEPNEFSGGYVVGVSLIYPEETKNMLYIEQLKENKIEYITHEKGYITTRLRDLAKVRLIMDMVEGREKDNPIFGQTIVDPQNVEFITLFKKRADESNLRVAFQEQKGEFAAYFMWEYKYREIIYQIEQDVEFEISKTW